jgi:para-nitrobenzyl esterase
MRRPMRKSKSKLPVMFWIHGGGYSGGSASEPRHNGDFLPTKGVVLVTINYRLGVFGFLATEDLGKEADGAAGNYGLMDMVAALEWVKANIRKFGGDPGQCDHLRRERRFVCGEHADGVAHGAGTVSQGHRRKRRRAGPRDWVIDSLAEREKRDAEWVATLGSYHAGNCGAAGGNDSGSQQEKEPRRIWPGR